MRCLFCILLALALAGDGWAGQIFRGSTTGGTTFEIRAFDTGTGTTSAECSMSVNSGEKLVVSSAAEQTSGDITISSSPSITWTSQIDQGNPTGGGGRARMWTAEASSTGTMTVTTTATSSGGSSCVLYAITGAESTLGGATANQGVETQVAPSVAITTTRADSILFGVTGDYNAASGAVTYRTPPTHTERLADRPSGTYNGWHYTAPATTTGSYTMGMTAPTGQASNTVVLEIRKP
jgi:hypothetical protein